MLGNKGSAWLEASDGTVGLDVNVRTAQACGLGAEPMGSCRRFPRRTFSGEQQRPHASLPEVVFRAHCSETCFSIQYVLDPSMSVRILFHSF